MSSATGTGDVARRPLLADRTIRRAVLSTFTGTLGAGIAPVGLILLCRDAGLSYTQIGIVLAGEAAGLLLGGPARGRAVDRRGQRAALIGFLSAHAVLLALLLAAVRGGAPVPVIACCAALASATFPPFTAVLRERWSALLPDPADRSRGFAAQAVTQEAVFVAGPLVATAVAVLLGTVWILPIMITATAAGVIGLLANAPPFSAHDRPPHPGWIGPLASPGVRVVVLAHVPLGVALGALEIAAVALSEHTGHKQVSGLLVAVFSLGSAAGGVAWSRRRRVDPHRAFPRLAAAFCAGLAPLVVVTSFGVALPLMALAGLAFAPLVATVYGLLDEVAVPGTTGEATTWLTTAMGLGAIVGSAAAGLLVDGARPSAAFAVPVVGAGLALAVALGGARALRASRHIVSAP